MPNPTETGTPTIYLLDVTNRDAVQTSRISLSKFQKTMVNWYLSGMGIHQSEAGFPTYKHEINYLDANVALAERGVFGDMIIAGWAPAKADLVERAIAQTNIKHLNISVSTSRIMTEGKFQGRMDRQDIIHMMTDAVDAAKAGGIETIGVNAEDASRTDMKPDEDYLIRFAQAAKEHGADRIRYCDTLGYDRVHTIYDSAKHMAEAVQLPIELHCHNDLGHAVANSVEGALGALDAGVDAYINVTVNGMGERAGNADLVTTMLALTKSRGLRDHVHMDPALDLTHAWKICNYVADVFGVPIPINQVGVGANAFAHESGIHADGVLKDRHNYELYSPEELGRGEDEDHEVIPTARVITTGEYGGRAGMNHVCEMHGITHDIDDQDMLELIMAVNGHNQLPLTPDEMRFIAEHPEETRQIVSLPTA
ncbi:MAG TPA: homocitrate synthase [Armatimonadota bacterium]|nr:homocitrate synthase [Armatimonadota bacterium]